MEKDYLEILYSEYKKPYTTYPYKLCQYISEKFFHGKKGKLLDVGCGRGEFLLSFEKLGFDVHGIDNCDSVSKFISREKIIKGDVNTDKFPFSEGTFDYVFCKSLIEHLNSPFHMLTEIFRILKKGGKAIIMTQDWESTYKWFYDDFTHQRPYTLKSLRRVLEIKGFSQIKVEKFYQLPFVWKCFLLKTIPAILKFFPDSLKQYKLFFFSKELMLIAEATK